MACIQYFKLGKNNYEIKDRSVRRKKIIPREKKISYDPKPKETIPVLRVLSNIPLMSVINSLDNSSLNGNCFPYGDIVSDNADTTSLALTQTTNQVTYHQTQSREYVANHVSLNNNSQTHRQQVDEASTTVLIQRTQELSRQEEKGSKHPRYSSYAARKASYSTFREFKNRDTKMFAMTGIFHTGKDDILQCFHCGIELRNSTTEKDIIIEHLKGSPDCSFLKDQLEIDRLNAYKAQIRSSERMAGASSNGATSITEFTLHDKIRSPEYQAYSTRLSTFARWPPSMMQKPDQVAEAGFYYTGLEDVVRCFACDGGLKNWDPEDDPWQEHARWFSKCPYVLKVKGPEYIQLVGRMVDEEEDSTVRSSYQRESLMSDLPCLEQLNIGDKAGPSQMETDAAEAVIQTGYSRKAVAMAIEELINKGMRQYTADNIMSIILDKEDRGESLPGDDDSSQACSATPNLYTNKDTIMQQNESLKSIITCTKCKEREKNILFLPCKHHCLCQACAKKCSLCPICYKTIKEKIKTYRI